VLTDHLRDTKEVEQSIRDIVLDYLSVGIDPEKSTIFIQSQIPQISELTMFFSMMVSFKRIQRNPTVKEEIKATGGKEVSYGFVGYPVSQAADILCVRANLVPVGKDQEAHLEQTREVAEFFNRTYGNVFPIPKTLLGKVSKLPGLDGQKMSKSRGNAIYLSDPINIVCKKVMSTITDTTRIHAADKGHPDGCNIFQYQCAFNRDEADAICKDCMDGKIGCVTCKKRLCDKLTEFLKPIQEKRKIYESDPNIVKRILRKGNQRTIEEASKTLEMVKEAMFFDYKQLF
jgi:tryptophanyl-tRNA synthetase